MLFVENQAAVLSFSGSCSKTNECRDCYSLYRPILACRTDLSKSGKFGTRALKQAIAEIVRETPSNDGVLANSLPAPQARVVELLTAHPARRGGCVATALKIILNVLHGKTDNDRVRKLRAVDLDEPSLPRWVVQQTTRVIRDTSTVKDLKKIHGNRCQICGTAVELGRGILYSEGHHIRPLGGEHEGSDEASNILIVCPNHHAQCDFGAIRLDLDALRLRPEHNISLQYIDYHNQHVFGR